MELVDPRAGEADAEADHAARDIGGMSRRLSGTWPLVSDADRASVGLAAVGSLGLDVA